MGSPPATEAEIAEYALEWSKVLGKNPKEAEQDVAGWRAREEPAHRVRISAFLMARTPLTRGQWRAVMPEAPDEWQANGSDDPLPATHLDWTQALAVCNALSEREGLAPSYGQDAAGQWHWERTADGYRLPTEAEWEYACRAGSQTRWFWGDDPEGADAHAWFSGTSVGQLHPVGAKDPNAWGLHDMAGLVWEWCWDRYGSYPDQGGTKLQDPEGPSEGDRRVVRGGSFFFPPFFLRSAYRGFFRPDDRGFYLGLRCVRSRVRQP
jgi:formylglycine-generating enzyme required for sulfatase activity